MPTHLSVFDLDHTLIRANTSFLFCRYLYRRGIFPLSTIFYSSMYHLRFHLMGMQIVDLHHAVFDRVLRGYSLEILEREVEPFIASTLTSLLYAPAVNELRLAQHLGHYTMILSSAPSFIVKAIAQFFDVNEWKATEYAVDKDKKFCNISSIMQGDTKANCVLDIARQYQINKENIAAYSDSILDLPLLLSAGMAVAVNPDQKLRRYSKMHNWKVI